MFILSHLKAPEMMSEEEINSNLDYFLDVDVSRHNEDLLSTLISCGRQKCDLEKLTELFNKLNYSEEEVKKYNLQEALNKTRAEDSTSRKRFKKNTQGPLEYDLKKICENYSQIKEIVKKLLEDKDFTKNFA